MNTCSYGGTCTGSDNLPTGSAAETYLGNVVVNGRIEAQGSVTVQDGVITDTVANDASLSAAAATIEAES